MHPTIREKRRATTHVTARLVRQEEDEDEDEGGDPNASILLDLDRRGRTVNSTRGVHQTYRERAKVFF